MNYDMSDLCSCSARKGAKTLYAYGCAVAPTIVSTCLHAGCFMGNFNSRYQKYKVSGDQFCYREVSGLNPVTSDCSVSCCYFETTDEMST